MDIVDELRREAILHYGLREEQGVGIPLDPHEVEFLRREDVRWRAADEIERLRRPRSPIKMKPDPQCKARRFI